mgnify:CR=1 FL=1
MPSFFRHLRICPRDRCPWFPHPIFTYSTSTCSLARALPSAPNAHPHIHPQEPFSRIKKELLKEAKTLAPGERVLVLGNSREPYLCAKKDEKVCLGGMGVHS